MFDSNQVNVRLKEKYTQQSRNKKKIIILSY